jgi:hypothetical protein
LAVPSGILFAWNGANSTTHSGWTRKTSLDGKFIFVTTGDDAGATGGSATHIHTSPNHTHTQGSHTHSITSGGPNATRNNPEFASGSAASATHTHATYTSNSTTATNQNTAITVQASADNLPPYYTVIWKESDGTTDIPSNFCGFFDSATLPTNWTILAGAIDKYIRGAGAGLDGAGTGGSLTHGHTLTDHTHTQDAHGHSGKASGTSSGTSKHFAEADYLIAIAHNHTVSLDSNTAVNQSATVTINAASTEPTYDKLAFIQNQTGGSDTPTGIIGLWLGLEANIPTGWTKKTITNDFVKCAVNTGEIGNTGGATQHLHTEVAAHNHTQNGHTHTGTDGGPSATLWTDGRDIYLGADRYHVHTWTGTSTVATNSASSITIDNCASRANYPEYVKVILVKKTAVVSTFLPRLMLLGAG